MKTINKYGPLRRKNITYQVGHEERDILVPLQAVTAAEGALPELLTGLPCTEVVRTANINGCMGNTYELRHRDGGNVCVNIPFVEDTAEDALVAVRIFRNVKECSECQSMAFVCIISYPIYPQERRPFSGTPRPSPGPCPPAGGRVF